MKLDDLQLLVEGVEVHGNELLAYVITVAEIFAEKSRFEADAAPYWAALLASNDTMAARALSGIKVEYTEDDPYGSSKELIHDVITNKRIKVYKTPDSKHPGMSAQQNDVFRALHDYLAHVGGNSQQFRRFQKENPGAHYKSYKMAWGSGFTVRGEMNAYVTHARVAPRMAIPALFTEIVGQICTYFVTGTFTVDKVAFMDGVDFMKVGVLHGKRHQRMMELLAIIEDDSVDEIPTKVNGIVLRKSRLNLKLLSRGSGQTMEF